MKISKPGPLAQARIEFGIVEIKGRRVYSLGDKGALHAPGAFEGAGIGLADIQLVIPRHGGRVFAEGVVGRGAKFFFTSDAASRG